MDFSPFNSSILASASADATVKIWGIPQGGLTASMSEPLVTLEGHTKKLALVKFNPTSANVIASAANDYNLKIWDVTKGKFVHKKKPLIPPKTSSFLTKFF